MKSSVKYGLITVAVIAIIVLVIPLQPQSIDRQAQQTETVGVDSNVKQGAVSCEKNTPFAAAYRVHTIVESNLEEQTIYRSQLDFRIQLQQSPDNHISGAATDIAISEATIGRDISEPRSIENVLFLVSAETGEHTVFTEFNDLGLTKQHPMTILSQLFKNLSVGDNEKAYSFTYDQLQREYRYRISKDSSAEIRRDLLSLNATSSTSVQLHPLWVAAIDEQCLPKSLQAEEVLPIASAGKTGSVRFIMQAERIDGYMDLSNLQFTAKANQDNQWNIASVKAADFAPKVTSKEEMWDIFLNFQQTRNTASLTRAAEYMIEHIPPYELADTLMQGELADDDIRDMIFGLGQSSRAETEDYLLDILVTLPANAGDNADLQKVRLMVAISGNDRVTEKAYNSLALMANDVAESPDIRRNALINMGSIVNQMQAQGRDTSAVSNSLDREIISHMQDGDSSSAIFAAGNAGLDKLSDTVTDSVLEKLQSTKQKERYASVRVLSSDSRYYDTLIDHLAMESSTLVGTAIVSGLRKEQLTGGQRIRLQEIGNTAPEQVRQKIDKLLGS